MAELFLGKEVQLFPGDSDRNYGEVKAVDDNGVVFMITKAVPGTGYTVGKLHFISFSARLSMKEVKNIRRDKKMGLKKVSIVDESSNTAPKFIKSKMLTYVREGDEPRQWEMIQSHDSVHVMVFNLTTQSFLMVKQVRIPVLVNNPSTDGTVIEACAGLVDKDIPLSEIVQEEILEELGYDVPTTQLDYIASPKTSVGTAGTTTHMYYAEVMEDQKIHDGGGLESEDIETVSLPLSEVSNFLVSGEVTDEKTMFLLMFCYNKLRDKDKM